MSRLRTVAARWASSVVALVLTALVVLAAVAFYGQTTGGDDEPPPPGTGVLSTEPSASPSASGSAGSPGDLSTGPPSTGVPSAGARSTGAASTGSSIASAGERAPVVVLNGSGVAGLGAVTAATLRAAGWDASNGSAEPRGVPATTLYVPSALEPAGRSLAAQFPRLAPRTAPAPPGFSTDRLTLVLEADYR